MEDELATLLAKLQEEGRFCSSGAFSIHLLAAAGKLRQLQMDPPERYVLKLIQAAVAAGGQSIEIDVPTRKLRLTFDRQLLSFGQLEHLGENLAEMVLDSGDRALQHFCIGINSSLACDLSLLVVESWNESERQVWTLTSSDQRLGRIALTRPQSPGTRVTLMKSRGWYDKEIELVKQSAQYCPVPIRVGLHRISQGRFGMPALPRLGFLFSEYLRLNDDYVFGKCHRNHHLLEVRWPEADPERAALGVSLKSAASSSQTFVPEGVEDPLAAAATPTCVRCRQVLAIEMDLKQTSRYQFIQDGALVATAEPFALTWGSVGLISANHLKTDLSQSRLIEDETYRATLKQINRDALTLEAIMQELVSNREHRSFPLARLVESRFAELRRRAALEPGT